MIHISEHAFERMNERSGINKKAARRLAEKAYELGVRHNETSGRLQKYITSKSMAYRKKGTCIRIYGEYVYCFVQHKSRETGEIEKVDLVTVFEIPRSLKNQANGVQKRKKEKVS